MKSSLRIKFWGGRRNSGTTQAKHSALFGLYPKLKKSKYGQFKQAWHLLRSGEEGVIDIGACVAEVEVALSI
jgi:hypothetical protein